MKTRTEKAPVKKRVRKATPTGKKPHGNNKFDYEGTEFLEVLERLSAKGLTDREIANSLLIELGEMLTPVKFNEHKNEKDENGQFTERAQKIREALARGRSKLNQVVRATYLQMALGQKKVKTTVRNYVKVKCKCEGQNAQCDQCGGTGWLPVYSKPVIQETEMELAPNHQALSVWLFNHDEDWRTATIEGKRLDITSNGKQVGGVIEIVDKTETVQ